VQDKHILNNLRERIKRFLSSDGVTDSDTDSCAGSGNKRPKLLLNEGHYYASSESPLDIELPLPEDNPVFTIPEYQRSSSNSTCYCMYPAFHHHNVSFGFQLLYQRPRRPTTLTILTTFLSSGICRIEMILCFPRTHTVQHFHFITDRFASYYLMDHSLFLYSRDIIHSTLQSGNCSLFSGLS
jgi:hypothetical protein